MWREKEAGKKIRGKRKKRRAGNGDALLPTPTPMAGALGLEFLGRGAAGGEGRERHEGR